jgi:hypothetical protein
MNRGPGKLTGKLTSKEWWWRQETRARSYEGISNQTYEEMMDEETMDGP